MYTQNTLNKSIRLLSKLKFSSPLRNARPISQGRIVNIQSTLLIPTSQSFRKESGQLHYRSSSPFLPRLRRTSSAHQVTRDGVSSESSDQAPLPSPPPAVISTDFPNRANCSERGCRPSTRGQRRIASSVLQLQSGLRSGACRSTLLTPALHSIDRQPNPT